MEVMGIIVIAILTEAIWENLKMLWGKGKFNINMLGSLIIAIIICILAKADIFILVGIDLSIKVIAYILTGIIASRGANFVNDLISRIRGT